MEEVGGIIKDIENGEEPLMLKICSGQATDEEIVEWFNEQGIPIEDKDQVLSMLSNSFNVGESMAEKIYPVTNLSDLSDEPSNTNNFPGCTKEDIMARLGLVLSELDTIRSQVITLINQVKMLN